MADDTPIASEFAKLPLEALIAAPLDAAAKAQRATAENTLAYIKSLTTNDVVQTQTFKYTTSDNGVSRNVQIDAPLLSLVPVPHLRIDSLTTHFKYEVAQSIISKKSTTGAASGTGGIKYLPFVELSLQGSVSSTSSDESSTNRSGVLEITVHASEAPIPDGLARILSMLAKAAEPKPISGGGAANGGAQDQAQGAN